MKDVLRKFALAGIGVFSLTREKAEQVVKELAEKGQVSAEEAKGMFRELVEKGEQEREALLRTIRSELNRLREEVGLATKGDLKALEERISSLEARLGQEPPEGGAFPR
jgi:polyhydroxyalkanoate synthesis regulator phasin